MAAVADLGAHAPHPAWLPADPLGGDALGVAGAGVGRDRVGVEAHVPAQVGEQRPDVGVVGVHEHRVRAEHVTGLLGRRQGRAVDEQRLRRRLLDVHHAPDLAGDLRLDVVALVEHERDARPRAAARRAFTHLVHDPEQLERVGRADHQVVVGVEARVEVEAAQLAEPEQRRDDELDVRARRVVAGVDDDLAFGPSATQWTSAVPQSGTSIV